MNTTQRIVVLALVVLTAILVALGTIFFSAEQSAREVWDTMLNGEGIVTTVLRLVAAIFLIDIVMLAWATYFLLFRRPFYAK